MIVKDFSQVLHPPTEYYIISVYVTSVCINSCIVYSYNVSDTNITITGLSLIDKYYTVTIIPVNIIGYGSSININGTISNKIHYACYSYSQYINYYIINYGY